MYKRNFYFLSDKTLIYNVIQNLSKHIVINRDMSKIL